MLTLVFQAYMELFRFDARDLLHDFSKLHQSVRSTEVDRRAAMPDACARVCRALDLACAWYWKQVLCLQRSAAVTRLLRRHGVAARMVVGTQQVPFAAHAWVEVDGAVVSDKPYMREMYSVLDVW